MRLKLAIAAATALAFALPSIGHAQPVNRSVVAIYHVAPGHHVEFLRWLDQQDRVSAAAGLPKGQLYAHTDGDSWDYVVIAPATTPQQDAAFDAAGTSGWASTRCVAALKCASTSRATPTHSPADR